MTRRVRDPVVYSATASRVYWSPFDEQESRAGSGPRMSAKPLIGVPADRRIIDPHPFHMVGEKYLTAVRDGAEALPFPIPALGDSLAAEDILGKIDGLQHYKYGYLSYADNPG